MTEVKTKFQSVYSAFVESKRLASFVDDKSLLPVYASSTAKIYPYQIAAARFALRSDYLKGCILCDEASLGKTYEALLVACQKWYEGKENILVILPHNLLQQWFRKLEKDFSTVPYIFWNNSRELPEGEGIVITTYDTANRYPNAVKTREWDLAIFDEADVLSKPDNKMVQTLKDAVGQAFKLLLTPTPITKDIRDIYGLIHFIDESVLPDPDWFYKRYFRKPENYPELTEWVSQFCFRTLKCQTTNYVNFTRRIPITVNYKISKEEKLIYDLISAYIKSDDKIAYPEIDDYNLSLSMFKSISSSPRAFSNYLEEPIKRTYGHEKEVLEEIKSLVDKIHINSKMTDLLKILKATFRHLKRSKSKQKAIIFVENSLTLDYVFKIILGHGYKTIKYKDIDSIEQFRFDDEIEILVANDKAAKGIDLEFCPVVVNYDLPYDTLKIEQRICRCHRQGQISDVLVINMLSSQNFADVRVLELINKRTKQFNGIWGMSDDILGNFNAKPKEVFKYFRHKKEVQEAFKTNLEINKVANEELVNRTEDVLFTTFTKSVADNVLIIPKDFEKQIDKINSDLWELIKFYFTTQRDMYAVDDVEKTLTRVKYGTKSVYDKENGWEQKQSDFLYYYHTGSATRAYEGREKYGLSKDFKPHYNRITYTSPLAKGLFSKWNWTFADEAKIYVDKDIEPIQVGFYEIDISSNEGYLQTKHIVIGQNTSGEIIPEEKCRDLLDLPVVEIENIERKEAFGGYTGFMGAGNLDFKINTTKIIEEYILSKQGSYAYEAEKLKMLAGRKKANLELHLKDLKTEINELKQKLNSKELDRLEELQITKQLKVVENNLRKQENDLFFDMGQVDVDTKNEIKELTEKSRFKARPSCYFKLYFLPMPQEQIIEEPKDPMDRYRIKPNF